MSAAPPSPFDRLFQAVQDGRLFELLGTEAPELGELDRQQLQFGLQAVDEDLGTDPDRLIAALRTRLDVNAEVKLHCVSWHEDVSEHAIVLGSADARDGWGMLLKSTAPDEPHALAWGWLCLFECPRAAELLCQSVEQDALRLTALRIERALQGTTLPLSFDRWMVLRSMLTESDVGQQLISAWDAHVREQALEEALPPPSAAERRGRQRL